MIKTLLFLSTLGLISGCADRNIDAIKEHHEKLGVELFTIKKDHSSTTYKEALEHLMPLNEYVVNVLCSSDVEVTDGSEKNQYIAESTFEISGSNKDKDSSLHTAKKVRATWMVGSNSLVVTELHITTGDQKNCPPKSQG